MVCITLLFSIGRSVTGIIATISGTILVIPFNICVVIIHIIYTVHVYRTRTLLCLLPAMLLSDVCLSVAYIGLTSRTERPRKTKIGTEIAHVTRDSGQGHQAALLTAALTRQAAAAVSVGTYSAWETTASTLRCARRR